MDKEKETMFLSESYSSASYKGNGGEFYEKVETKLDGEKKKVTYILQTSDTHHQTRYFCLNVARLTWIESGLVGLRSGQISLIVANSACVFKEVARLTFLF